MSQTAEQMPEASATPAPARSIKSRLANISLGIWSFYFIAKLALYWKELIGFHTLENLAFAAFILFPVKHVLWRRVKQAATVLLAVMLLYYDSWLPAIGRVLSQASLVSSFNSAYLIELSGRFISLPVVAMLVVACAAYWLVSRWVRLDAVIIAVMAGMAMAAFLKSPVPRAVEKTEQTVQPDQPTQPDQPAQAGQSIQPIRPTQSAQTNKQPVVNNDANTNPDMDKVLRNFFSREAARSVSLPLPKADAIPFDIIFIHVCSLSWDDVRTVGLEHHPLWNRFDIVLTRFNSAAAYSGPAAIRLLRATCGQSPHASLYAPSSDKCYLMDNLKRSGFEPGLALNHDGHFDQFLQTVQTQGHLNVPPFPLNGVAINQYAFDDSPIYEDLSLLTHWLENRQKSNSPRVALFYNTVSLHDGNHLIGVNSNLNSRETFKIRLAKFLDDLEIFMKKMESSGRRAVVVMIPEHGAALRGDKMQIAGLREIPSPAITLVPVGIKVIGGDFQREGNTLSLDGPTSYLAVSHIVARLLEKSPFTKNSFAPSDYVADLPTTQFVSQNDEVTVAGYDHRYYLRQDEAGWVDYSDLILR